MTRLATLRRLIRLHPFAATLFGLGLLAALFFAVRTVAFVAYWHDPDHRQATPEPWMTPRYIAMSWHIPPEEVAAILAIPEDMPHRPTLEKIAKARGISVDQLIAELTAALAARKATE